VAYERSGQDDFTGYLLDLIGMGTKGLQNRMAVPDQALIGYEGLLAQYPRSAGAFRQMLEDYFEVRWKCSRLRHVAALDAGRGRVLETVVALGTIGRGDRAGRRGVGPAIGGAGAAGPMPLDQYRDFLPGARLTNR